MVRRLKELSTTTTEDEHVSDAPSPIKNKKHKHKRPKKLTLEEEIDSDTSIDVSFEDSVDKPAFKVKLKTNRDKSNSAAEMLKVQATKVTVDPRKPIPSCSSAITPTKVKKKKGKGRDSSTSSEEERWLDAIQSGKLEEVDDELKKMKLKDPKMMTARQRAMYERGTDKESSPGEVLLALPSGYKEKVMTAEAIQKAALKSQKRKQLADEKREKDKKKTMERLLKKQESKNLKNTQKSRVRRSEPMIVYKNTIDEISLALPIGVSFPMEAKSPISPPKIVTCSIEGCENIKKYNCSITGVPLCSLECYKKNILLHKVTISG